MGNAISKDSVINISLSAFKVRKEIMNLTSRDTICVPLLPLHNVVSAFAFTKGINKKCDHWIWSNAVTFVPNINIFYNLIIKIVLIVLFMFVACVFCNQTWNM